MSNKLKPERIKKDFPIFNKHPDLVYLDSTATALKPRAVIAAVNNYYENYSANVFRGLYPTAEKTTAIFEKVREQTARFLNAQQNEEIIFVRNTTEALNLIAYSLGRQIITKGSEIVVSLVEHHSNFVPWQQLALENEAVLKVLEPDEHGLIPLEKDKVIDGVINKNTKIVALYYISNVLGTINPLAKIIKQIKKKNPDTIVIVDAAQAAPSIKIDVQALGCDFLAFSGHKMMGPTGIGILWGKQTLLEQMYPFLFGGEMISEVYLKKTVFQKPPLRFEAGTPDIAGVFGLGAAITYLSQLSFPDLLKHEQRLWKLTWQELKNNPNIVLLGPEKVENRTGILSFWHKKIHAHDLAQIMSDDQVCIRTGHHCAMPLHQYLKIPASARLSYYLYNTGQDVKSFMQALSRAEKMLI